MHHSPAPMRHHHRVSSRYEDDIYRPRVHFRHGHASPSPSTSSGRSLRGWSRHEDGPEYVSSTSRSSSSIHTEAYARPSARRRQTTHPESYDDYGAYSSRHRDATGVVDHHRVKGNNLRPQSRRLQKPIPSESSKTRHTPSNHVPHHKTTPRPYDTNSPSPRTARVRSDSHMQPDSAVNMTYGPSKQDPPLRFTRTYSGNNIIAWAGGASYVVPGDSSPVVIPLYREGEGESDDDSESGNENEDKDENEDNGQGLIKHFSRKVCDQVKKQEMKESSNVRRIGSACRHNYSISSASARQRTDSRAPLADIPRCSVQSRLARSQSDVHQQSSSSVSDAHQPRHPPLRQEVYEPRPRTSSGTSPPLPRSPLPPTLKIHIPPTPALYSHHASSAAAEIPNYQHSRSQWTTLLPNHAPVQHSHEHEHGYEYGQHHRLHQTQLHQQRPQIWQHSRPQTWHPDYANTSHTNWQMYGESGNGGSGNVECVELPCPTSSPRQQERSGGILCELPDATPSLADTNTLRVQLPYRPRRRSRSEPDVQGRHVMFAEDLAGQPQSQSDSHLDSQLESGLQARLQAQAQAKAGPQRPRIRARRAMSGSWPRIFGFVMP